MSELATERLPIGTHVEYWKGSREGLGKISRTRTEVQDFHGNPVVWVEGEGAFIAMTHVERVEVYPSQIGVFCDLCGGTVKHDYWVHDRMDQPARFEVARRHLAENEHWRCDAGGDFCPVCKVVSA